MSDVPLRDYIDTRIGAVQFDIASLKDYMQQHFEMDDRALQLANDAMLARLESMNEFRAQIREERVNLATKEDIINCHDRLNARICPLEEAKAFSSGKMWMVMVLFAAVPTVLALIALFR